MSFNPTGDEMDEKQLSWGYWWVTHVVQVRKVFTIILGIFAFSLVAYASWGFIDWFAVSGVNERAWMSRIVYIEVPKDTWVKYGAKIEPIFDSPVVLGAGEGRYDMFARATNQNDNWMITFDYHIEASGIVVQAKEGFLLPGETKNLHTLGVQSESRPASPQLVITNMQWHRVDLHEVRPEYETWSKARLNLLVRDVEYLKPSTVDVLPVSRVHFVLENDTGFNYYTTGFFVTLLSGQKVVGVNYVIISDLKAGERRSVEATWFNDLPNVTRVEVAPEVNILDPDSYIAPGE